MLLTLSCKHFSRKTSDRNQGKYQPYSSLPWSFLIDLVLRFAKGFPLSQHCSWLAFNKSSSPHSNFSSVVTPVILSVSCTLRHTNMHTQSLTHVHFHMLPLWLSCVHVSEFFPADLMSPTIQKIHQESAATVVAATVSVIFC